MKLKPDRAAKGNPGPAGGIIRGSRGEVHEVFALNCGVWSCTKAELLVVLRGLLIAWDCHHKKELVSVDSEVVAKILVSEAPLPSPYIHIMKHCHSLTARKEWKIAIEHCHRESNQAADWLANMGVRTIEKLVLLEADAKDLHAILLKDLSGVAWARMVPA